MAPHRSCQWAKWPCGSLCFIFSFSANHLPLLLRTDHRSCAAFLLRDVDTQRVYLLDHGAPRLSGRVGTYAGESSALTDRDCEANKLGNLSCV